ncbi:MAG: hypothetical protein KAQ85_11700, partial [Thermodesulfovibrionia bacterium]|nr:hypothetical protein [Thermodesulfovibrionia bacterium]
MVENLGLDKGVLELVLEEKAESNFRIFEPDSLKGGDRFSLLSTKGITNLRYHRMIDVCKMRELGFPIPEVNSNFANDRLRGNINLVMVVARWSEDLLAIQEGVLRTKGINLIIASPYSPVFIYENLEGVASIKLTEGLLHDTNNRLVLACLREPLEIHYIWNFSEENAGKFQRMGIPINAPYEAVKLLVSKIRTQEVLSKSGIRAPPFIAVRKGEYTSTEDMVRLREKLEQFIKENKMEKFVVKPSEGACGRDVIIYPSHQDAIYEAVYMICQMSQQEDIIIEEYQESAKYKVGEKELDRSLRIFTGRDRAGDIKVNGSFTRVGKGVVNISLGADVKKWDKVLSSLAGYSLTRDDVAKLKERICNMAIDIYKCLDNEVKRRLTEGESCLYGLTDSVAVDFLFDGLKPVVGEVNDFYGGQYDWD